MAPQDDFVTAATAAASYIRLRRDSSFGAFGWANGQIFARLDGSNQAQFGLGVSGRKALQSRLDWRYMGAYSDGVNLDALYGGGPAPPQVDVKSAVVSTGTTFALTPRTSWNTSLDGTYLRYRARIPFDTAALPLGPQVPVDVSGAIRPTPIPPGSLVLPDGTEILRLLTGESLLAQRLDYSAWRLGTGLTHAFSAKTTANLGVGYRFTHESPRSAFGGEHFDASLGFSRVLDTTTNLSGGYAFQSGDYASQGRVHGVSVQVAKEFDERWRGDLTLGASYLDGTTPSATGWTWIGGVGTSIRFDRGNLAARYSRTVYQGQIVPSTQISDTVSVGGGHTFTKRVFASAFGYYVSTRDQGDGRFSYDSGYVVAALSVRLSKRTSGGLSYLFQTFDGGTLPDANRSYLTAFFGYTRSWK